MNLNELVNMSNRYGVNPAYVLAGGGNTSVKDEESLYVKCSGTQLSTITKDGFVRMSRTGLNKIMENTYPSEDAAREAAYLADVMCTVTDSDKTKRPSVEALLHNLFPQVYVLHIHPTLVNGLTCSKGGEALAHEILGDEILWIDACRPGYTLARICCDQMKAYEDRFGHPVRVVLLQNHGIFVAADTISQIDSLFDDIMARLTKAATKKADLTKTPSEEKAAAAKELETALGHKIIPVSVAQADAFSLSKESAAPLLTPFTPDHIVYCGPYALYIENVHTAAKELEAFAKAKGVVPRIILLKDRGAFLMEDNRDKADKAAMLFNDALQIAVYAENFGGPLTMSEDLTQFIIHWEAESYRSKK